MTAECKAGETEMLGATCRSAVLYITNVKWTTLGQDTGNCVGRPKVLYTLNCDYSKILGFSLVSNTFLNWAVLKMYCKSAIVSFFKPTHILEITYQHYKGDV
jgi:hypothetical protein